MARSHSKTWSYVGREYLLSFTVAFLFFFFLFFLNQILVMAEEIFSKKVAFWDVLRLILYSLPVVIAFSFPVRLPGRGPDGGGPAGLGQRAAGLRVPRRAPAPAPRAPAHPRDGVLPGFLRHERLLHAAGKPAVRRDLPPRSCTPIPRWSWSPTR